MRYGALLTMCLSFLATLTHAGILVVDQDPSNQAADYEQLQPAMDAAQAGDTIYVMPSATTYENATIEKSLTLIGAGMAKEAVFPAAPSLESRLGEVTIKASDVFLTGFVFAENLAVLAPSSNITIFRNHFDHRIYDGRLGAYAVEEPSIETTISHLHVINNRFSALSTNDLLVDLFHSGLDEKGIFTEVIDFVFANNIVLRGRFYFQNGDGEVYNNYFDLNTLWFRENGATGGTVYSRGRFYNNLIQRGSLADDRIVRTHNAYSTFVDSGRLSDPSNLKYDNLEDLILNKGGWGMSHVLTPDSPLKGAGMNGEDIGILGGLHAWNLNHQPPVPIITKLQAPRIVGAGENLSLQIEVQPNN